jgi:hypothetical protein
MSLIPIRQRESSSARTARDAAGSRLEFGLLLKRHILVNVLAPYIVHTSNMLAIYLRSRKGSGRGATRHEARGWREP